jgi:hypothetical protein
MQERKCFMVLAFAAFLAAAAASAGAQSNEFVDGLLAKPEASFGQVSYLVLVASDNIGEDADEARAFDLLQNLKWAPAGAAVNSPVRLDEYALILMRAFGMKGGIMQRVAPSPRYAYRELAYLQVIQGRSDPAQRVSGTAAVQMLGRVFDVMGLNK